MNHIPQQRLQRQPAQRAAPQTGLACRRLGQLGRRCRRCFRYCGILFIAVVCLMYMFPYGFPLLGPPGKTVATFLRKNI